MLQQLPYLAVPYSLMLPMPLDICSTECTYNQQAPRHLQQSNVFKFNGFSWISCDFLQKAHRCSTRRYVFQKRLSCEAQGSRPVNARKFPSTRIVQFDDGGKVGVECAVNVLDEVLHKEIHSSPCDVQYSLSEGIQSQA